MPVTPHIQVRRLNVWYKDQHALRDISLEVPDRKITAIVGPSGCGKTTLLRSFNLLHELDWSVRCEGEILVDGENLLGPGVDVNRVRRKLGLLFQRPVPLPMSIYENVAYGPRIHGITGAAAVDQLRSALGHTAPAGFDERLAAAARAGRGELDLLVEFYLRLAGLWDEVADRLRAPAAELSVGQQQRLCLARGLAVEPEVILADEPTSALDPPSARLIEDQFLALRKHYTIVVVTHTRAQARRIADHLVFLYMGELVESGPATAVFADPRDDRTRRYLEGKFVIA